MSNPIQELQKQTMRYYYEDGLVELAVGILFGVIGLDTYLISILPPGTPLSIIAWILLPLLTVGGLIGVQRFVKNQKERHVHPRTGYIEYSPKPRRYRWSVSAIILALTVSIIFLPYDWLQKGSVAGGMTLFVILATIGASVGLKRLIALGGLSMVFGVLFAYLPLSDHASLAVTFLSMGIVLTVIGALVFRKYLQKNPLPEEAA